MRHLRTKTKRKILYIFLILSGAMFSGLGVTIARGHCGISHDPSQLSIILQTAQPLEKGPRRPEMPALTRKEDLIQNDQNSEKNDSDTVGPEKPQRIKSSKGFCI